MLLAGAASWGRFGEKLPVKGAFCPALLADGHGSLYQRSREFLSRLFLSDAAAFRVLEKSARQFECAAATSWKRGRRLLVAVNSFFSVRHLLAARLDITFTSGASVVWLFCVFAADEETARA